MAEFECGYCTGCGVRVRRWGHRPYCWREVMYSCGLSSISHERRRHLLAKMSRFWRFRSLFLVRKQHMYYQPGYDIPEPSGPLRVTEIEQDGNEVLTHLSDGRCAVNRLPKEGG